MTRVATLFDPKDVLEKDVISFTFASSMDVGETITTAEIDVEVFSGVDASPMATKSGSHNISATAVTQLVQGGVQDTSYLYRCKATLSSGRVLISCGILPVVRIAK